MIMILKINWMVKCFIICGTLWSAFVLMVWVHIHSCLDSKGIINKVGRILDVPSCKLVPLNHPRNYCPVSIFECLEARSNVLDQCESLIPDVEGLVHVREEDRGAILQVFVAEADRKKQQIYNAFRRYEISLNEEIGCLYSAKGLSKVEGRPREFIVVETKGRLYALYWMK